MLRYNGIIELLKILPVLLYSAGRFVFIKYGLFRVKFPEATEAVAAIKLIKYITTSGVIGYLSAGAIRPDLRYYQKMRYSRFIMDWGLFILILDGVSDYEKCDDEYSEEINIFCYKIIGNKIVETNGRLKNAYSDILRTVLNTNIPNNRDFNPQTPLSEVSMYLAYRIASKIPGILYCEDEKAEELAVKSLHEVAALCKGQIDSVKQKKYSKNYNWKWYSKNVLNNKTIYIYSIIYLFAQNNKESENANKLCESLLLVNDLYLNRQLLDDMNDIKEDCMDQIYAGPAYLLVDELEDYTSSPDDVCSYIPAQIKNRTADISFKSQQANLFHSQLSDNPEMAALTLINSGVPDTIIQIIEDAKRFESKYVALQTYLEKYSNVVPLSTLFYYRCSKSLMKAKRILSR
jgi:hypothetical protein